MKAIILVAGYATRLYPLTLDIPKALLPVNNKPILDYIMDEVNKVKEIDEVFIVSNHKFYTQFEKWAENYKEKPLTVLNDGSTDIEDRKGAIGDILFAIKTQNINDEIIVIAGDNLFTYDLLDYYNYYKSVNNSCVCVKEMDDYEALKRFGIAEINDDNKLIGLEEKPQNPKSNLVAYATYFYPKDVISLFETYIQEGNNPDAPGYFVQWLYKRKDIYAYKMNGECYDIGSHEVYDKIQNLFKNYT